MKVTINNKTFNLTPDKIKGQGGEAEVYDIGGSKVAKIFKTTTHPDFAGNKQLQTVAQEKISEHQRKLPAFPKGVHPSVIEPLDLVYDKKNIVGYTMQFLKNTEVLKRYSERSFRDQGVPEEIINNIFLKLFDIVESVHDKKIIIGDFNDLNVLVSNDHKNVYMIDADSMQFKNFICHVFTEKYVDPLLCDKNKKRPLLIKPHNENSDWYAFNIMLMESLLFVGPYGGIHKPKNPKERCNHDKRPLQRITIFSKDVVYPKPARHFKILPDDLLHHFTNVFQQDKRGQFPQQLLKELTWKECDKCHSIHARSFCPVCNNMSVQSVITTTQVTGKVVATRILKTNGVILFAAYQNGKLRYFYHTKNKSYCREDDLNILNGDLKGNVRYCISQEKTYMARAGSNQIIEFVGKQQQQSERNVGHFGNLPLIEANSNGLIWIDGDKLLFEGQYGNETIGSVLEGQTLFWAGEKFGFGFYRAGSLNRAFVFKFQKQSINDSVSIRIQGKLIDSTCTFTNHLCWFFLTLQIGNRRINQCYLINEKGEKLAYAETDLNDNSWLGQIRGKMAIGNQLFVPHDEGIIRVDYEGGNLIPKKTFTDTEKFVNENSNLFPAGNGIYVVNRQEIFHLKMF